MRTMIRFLIAAAVCLVLIMAAFAIQSQGFHGGYLAGVAESQARIDQLESENAQLRQTLAAIPVTTPQAPNAPTKTFPSPEGYIGNTNSLKFHLPSCRNLPGTSNQIFFSTRQDAIDAGFEPCGVCNP